jgi:hypothetical protein
VSGNVPRQPQSFNLSAAGLSAEVELREITGKPASCRTRVRLMRESRGIRVDFDSEDPDILQLISSVSAPGADRFLYEEDCVQVAIAMPDSAREDDYILANPHGSRSGTKDAMGWPVAAERGAYGWRLSVLVPTPESTPAIGLSVHRFFRGVNNEVQGIEGNLPYPLKAAEFSVIVLEPGRAPHEVAREFTERARAASNNEIQRRLSSVRQRIAAARRSPGPRASLATAKAFALRRASGPMDPLRGMWNETHFQHALVDLWELERDPHWVEMAIPRVEYAWSMRADRTGALDCLRGRKLPTWYYDTHGVANTLSSAVILDPIMRLARTVHDAPELQHLWPSVERWCKLAQETIGVHDDEWVELPSETGWYIEPYPKGPRRVYPSGGSRLCPFNRALWLGRPMIHLARMTGRKDYLDKAAKMARFFLANSETQDNGALVWEYAPQPYRAAGEDLSHAACQVHFAELCAAEGIAIGDDTLRRMAATLERNVMRYGDVPCDTVRGEGPGLHFAVASWSPLCRYVPHVLPRIIEVLETAMAEGEFDFASEGWGVRLLTMVEKAKRLTG